MDTTGLVTDPSQASKICLASCCRTIFYIRIYAVTRLIHTSLFKYGMLVLLNNLKPTLHVSSQPGRYCQESQRSVSAEWLWNTRASVCEKCPASITNSIHCMARSAVSACTSQHTTLPYASTTCLLSHQGEQPLPLLLLL